MQILELDGQTSEKWHQWRLGKITGTRLGTIWSSRQYTKDDIVKLLDSRGVEYKKSDSKKKLEELLTDEDKNYLSSDAEKKLEYYQILADQVAVAPDDEDGEQYRSAMDRGVGKEDDACQAFADYSGKELLVVDGCASDVDPRIVNSPDRLIKPADGEPITEAVEAKCLASAKHLMAFFERKTPEEYWTQKVQYFVVNEKLQRLYWVFYDPRVTLLPMFTLVIEREDLGHWPETMLKYQLKTLAELDTLTTRLFNESDTIMLPAKAENK